MQIKSSKVKDSDKENIGSSLERSLSQEELKDLKRQVTPKTPKVELLRLEQAALGSAKMEVLQDQIENAAETNRVR